MGGWGNGLYQNDVALDVRELVEAALDDGRPPHDVAEEMIGSVFGEYNEWERAVAWLALGDTLLSRGYVTEELKTRVLAQIQWFEACGLEEKNMMGDALRDLKRRFEQVPSSADAEKSGMGVLSEIEQQEEPPEPVSAGRFGWLGRIRDSLIGKR